MSKSDDLEQEELVRRAAEQSRLLPGENSQSKEPEDINQWIRVYTELLGFKSRILAEMKRGLGKMSARAATEIREIDVALVERQERRYQRRLEFWQDRANELAGSKQPQPTKDR